MWAAFSVNYTFEPCCEMYAALPEYEFIEGFMDDNSGTQVDPTDDERCPLAFSSRTTNECSRPR